MTRPEADLLPQGRHVVVGGRPAVIVRRSGTAAKPILRLDLFSSRSEVEAVRGEALLVDRDDAPPLEADEYWADDLVGLAVVDGAREVGTVERVLALPSCEVLVVGELLIPLVDDAVRSVDLEARQIDVSLEFLGES